MQRKRKNKNRKVYGRVFQTGGMERNLRITQVEIIRVYNSSNCFCIELDLEKVMSADEKKKLYDAIGYEGEDTSTSSYPATVSWF